MKINSIKSYNPAFKAGVTNLFSDFDGTLMPKMWRHDSIVKNNPPINEDAFKKYFDKFKSLLDAIRGNGKEPKLNFSVTTGRNIHEFNYLMQKLKERNLEIPLPDTLITCNGGDEFLSNPETGGFFRNSAKVPFLMKDVNRGKIEWIKQKSGWDGQQIREAIKNELQETVIPPALNFEQTTFIGKIKGFMPSGMRKEWANDLLTTQRTESELVRFLEDSSKSFMESMNEGQKNSANSTIKEIAKQLTGGTHRFHILEAPTNQCNYSYPNSNLTLQSKLEQLNPIPKYYASLRQDGDLSIQTAFPWLINPNTTKDYIHKSTLVMPKGNEISTYTHKGLANKIKEKFPNMGISLKCRDISDEAFNNLGTKTSALELRPELKLSNTFLDVGGTLDKRIDIQRKAKEIVDKGLNDLIIVAGDGSNDVPAIDLRNYIRPSSFDMKLLKVGMVPPEKLSKESLKKLNKLPIMSIFVINPNKKDYFINYIRLIEGDLNQDGVVRCILVDKGNSNYPQSLDEAVEIAIREYSKRNRTFKKNLTPEMQERIKNNTKEYPIMPRPKSGLDKIKKLINSNKKFIIPALLLASAGLAICLGIKKHKKVKQMQPNNISFPSVPQNLQTSPSIFSSMQNQV